MTKKYLEQVLLGEERGPLSWVIRGILLPGSLVYRAGLAVYLALYERRVRKRHRLPVPVISVGNLTFGGTGKTPAVIELCRILVEEGKRVVVLSRGHGGSASGTLVVSDGVRVVSTFDRAGDEPVMLANALPGVPVVVDNVSTLPPMLAAVPSKYLTSRSASCQLSMGSVPYLNRVVAVDNNVTSSRGVVSPSASAVVGTSTSSISKLITSAIVRFIRYTSFLA